MESISKSNAFLDLQEAIFTFPPFPSLWFPHCLMMSMVLRSTLGNNWKNFSKNHPLSCFMLAIIYTFPGGILASACLAQPILAFMAQTNIFVAMLFSWYLIFYSPGDIVVTLIETLRLKLPFGAMQDFLRIQLVLSGVQTIHKQNPDIWIYPIVFAIIKSSGFMFVKYTEYILVNGVDRAFIIPHHSTKSCILASILFTFQSTGHLPVDLKPLFTVTVLLAVGFRLMTAFTAFDPYAPFENLVSAICFGREEVLDTKTSAKAKKVQ